MYDFNDKCCIIVKCDFNYNVIISVLFIIFIIIVIILDIIIDLDIGFIIVVGGIDRGVRSL